MRTARALGVLLILASLTVTPGFAPASATAAPAALLSEADVAERVAPSVVQVITEDGYGSGVRIQQGVLTNAHVVEAADQVQIATRDGSRGTATVSWTDGTLDLALLSTDLDLRPLETEPARRQRQGETVLVLGYPYADVLEGEATLTRGLLSAVRERDGVVLVQTDAAINQGNSGGPIVNMQGKLIGVAAYSLRGSTGLNFGIATESVDAFFAPIPGDGYEPDNARESARTLEAGGSPQQRNLHAPGDIDWMGVSMDAGERLRFSVEAHSCQLFFSVYGPDGARIRTERGRGTQDGSALFGFTALEAGTHYAQVRHTSERGVCRAYEIGGRRLAAMAPDEYEPDDLAEHASSLEVDGPAQEHSLHLPGDVDWVSFSLEAGSRVLVLTSGRCDTYLYLYGPDAASLLAEDDDGGGDVSSLIAITAPSSATYYARVTHFNAQAGMCESYGISAMRM